MMQIHQDLMMQKYSEKIASAAERHRIGQALKQRRARDELRRAVFQMMKVDGDVRTLMEEFPLLIRQAEARLCGQSQVCRTAQQ